MRDLTVGNTTEVAILYSQHANHTAHTAEVDIVGWTTATGNRIIMRTALSSRNYGVAASAWSTSKSRISVNAGSGAFPFTVEEDYMILDGLQIESTNPTGSTKHVLNLPTNFTSINNELIVKNCIIKGHNNNTYTQAGINVQGSNIKLRMFNSIVYNIYPVSASTGVMCNTAGTGAGCQVYSSTIIGGNNAVRRIGGTMIIKNVYAGGSLGGDYTGTITKTTSASSDNTADGTSPQINIAVNTSNFTNVTGGSENFHLPVGSGLLDLGTDTSGDTAPMNFTKDIDLATRSGSWDIGADER